MLSGAGSTFRNIHDHIQAGLLNARIACVIASRTKAKGLDRARDFGYPAHAVSFKAYANDAAFSRAIDEHLFAHDVDIVVLAGFMRRYLPAPAFSNSVVNIHPALIPAFSGKGFYGMHVHRAVWQKGVKLTGCTVHLVDDEYDQGPIILQEAIALEDQDTPEIIQDKVQALERTVYPKAIQLLVDGRVSVTAGRTMID